MSQVKDTVSDFLAAGNRGSQVRIPGNSVQSGRLDFHAFLSFPHIPAWDMDLKLGAEHLVI